MENKLSDKAITRIAIMWSASILKACDASSFLEDFDQEDEVIKRVHKIASQLLGDLPMLFDLEEIIRYAKINNL